MSHCALYESNIEKSFGCGWSLYFVHSMEWYIIHVCIVSQSFITSWFSMLSLTCLAIVTRVPSSTFASMAVRCISTYPVILARAALAVTSVFNVKNIYLDEYVFVQSEHVSNAFFCNTAFFFTLFMCCSLRFRMRVFRAETLTACHTWILLCILVRNESDIIGVYRR